MSNSVPFQYTTTASTNLVRVGGGSGAASLCEGVLLNTNTTYAIYVKLYWAPNGVTPVVGTTVPTVTYGVSATNGTTFVVGQTTMNLSNPITSNGQLWMWVTTNPAATDTTATAAGDGIITLFIN